MEQPALLLITLLSLKVKVHFTPVQNQFECLQQLFRLFRSYKAVKGYTAIIAASELENLVLNSYRLKHRIRNTGISFSIKPIILLQLGIPANSKLLHTRRLKKVPRQDRRQVQSVSLNVSLQLARDISSLLLFLAVCWTLARARSVCVSTQFRAGSKNNKKTSSAAWRKIKSFHRTFFSIDAGNYFLTLFKLTTCKKFPFQSATFFHHTSDVRFFLSPGQTALH